MSLVLPDGSIVRLVHVKRVRAEPHFRSSKGYYVDLDMRDGTTREDIQEVPRAAAEKRRDEIVSMMQGAWGEVDAYEAGRGEAAAEAWSAGYAEGSREGRSEGYERGQALGFDQGKQHALSYVQGLREQLMREQDYGDQLPPSRRRYLRNAIEILTDVTRRLSEDYPENY